jgi:hypothetical protein
MVPARQRRQDQKNVPGPPSQENDSGRVTESHDVPADGHATGDGFVPIRRPVLGLDFATLFPPQAEEGGFIVAQDDAGIRAPDEIPASNDKTASARAPRYANSERNRGITENHRDLSIEVYRAENKVLEKFGILTVIERDLSSLEDRDKAIYWEGLQRMEAGLPRSYKKQLKMVLARVNNLAWMRIYYRDDIGAYLRCFA